MDEKDDYSMYSVIPEMPPYQMYQSFGDEADDYTMYTDKIPEAYGTPENSAYDERPQSSPESEMEALEHHIQELTGLINYSGDAPEWVQSKISRAAQLISQIANYLHGEIGDAQDMHMSEYLLRSEEDQFESLEKSVTQYKQMLGDAPEHQEAFETAKKMPNSNWGGWVVKNYKKNPEQFHKVKDELVHFSGMQHIPDVAQHRFGPNDTFESGLQELHDKVEGFKKLNEWGRRIVKPRKTTKKILDVGNGMAWYSLGVPACGDEASALVHCGNQPSQQPYHDILSLRTAHKIRGKEYHEPHVTFINDKENNVIGEMKAYDNLKPGPEYHDAIAKLFAHGYVPMGGGYEVGEKKNFHIDDLGPEHRAFVLKHNPEAFAMSSDPELSAQALEKLL